MAPGDTQISFNQERSWRFMPSEEERSRYYAAQERKYGKNDYKKLGPVDSDVSKEVFESLARWPHVPHIALLVSDPSAEGLLPSTWGYQIS
jgi:hypothetical protein